MSKVNTRKVSDADLSNAGDDFHVLWAIKKSLELLNFDEKGLKAVCLEGIEKNESKELDPTGEKFLGIDLCEYYGGEDFEKANNVVITQIKYSTNRQDQNYTFSELYEGKKPKSSKGSIIHRLASIVKPFLEKYERDQVLSKIKIKLVSNRNVNTSHKNKINEVQEYLKNLDTPICFKKLMDVIPVPKEYSVTWKEPFLKLLAASELNSKDFTDFFRLLDFNDCGSDSRIFLKLDLVHSISKMTKTSKNHFNSLFQLIWNKLQPEKRNDRMITYMDVIANFEFSTKEDIFPVSQDFEELNISILREQIPDIISILESNSAFVPICIHGGAGYGKTTIVNQIKEKLPDYCECILFDCYGKGKYENSSDKRHLHSNAIMQIANDLGKQIGSDLLLVQNESDHFYLRELNKRIKQAVEILKDRNSNAYLTIIIDAADNSIGAASKFGERSFVQDLLEEVIEGFNLIVTCRTYRKVALNLPKKYIDIELLPFSLNETKLYLTDKLEKATDEEFEEFHEYTYGIPRVQSYSLELQNQGINEIINYLKPNGKRVEDLILDKVEEAKKRLGKEKETLIDKFFSSLITLPRPVPITYIAETMDVDVSFVKDIAVEIWHGLILEYDHFSFRDEDFENYIKDNYTIALGELKEIAKFFLIKAETDEYASINLASILYRAEYFEELTKITLNRKLLIYPEDHIRNKEVYINRVKLALQIARNSKDELTFFKLLFIAGEETKTDRIINDLMIEYPDLITRFGDEKSLLRLKLNSDEKFWAGSFYLKLAGINSRKQENKDITLNYLKLAQDWHKWRQTIKDDREKIYKYNISAIDIAYQVEANLRVFGIGNAMNTLNRWTPLDARLKAAEHFFDNVVRFSTPEQIIEWLTFPDFKIHDKIFITCSLHRYNKKSMFNLEDITKELLICLNIPKIKFILNFQNYIVDFCSILIYNKIGNSIVLELLSKIKTHNLDRVPSFYKSYSDDNEILFNIQIAKETLIAELNKQELLTQHFYPDRLKNIDQTKNYKKAESLRSDLEEFDTFYRHVIPVYTLLSQIYLGTLNPESSFEHLKSLITSLKSDYRFDHQLGYRASDHKVYIIEKYTDVALLLTDFKEIAINFIFETYKIEKNALQIKISILNKVIYHEDLNTLTLKHLYETDKLIKSYNLSGQETMENYISCINVSNKINESFSRYLLEETINASKDIDMEAFEKIRCISTLTEIALNTPNPELAYEFAKFIEFSDMKLQGYEKKHFPYVRGLEGIVNLDISSVLPVMCRWHHRNVVKINEEIMPILSHLLKSEYLDHIVVSSLLPIVSYYRHPSEIGHIYELIFNKYDLAGNSKLKSKFVRSEFRNLRLDRDHNGIEKLFESIKSGRYIDNSLVEEVKNFLDFRETIYLKGNYASKHNSEERAKHNFDIRGIEYTTTNGLKKALSAIISEDSKRYNNQPIVKELLNEVVEKCSSNQYIQFLNALVDQDEDLISFYTFEEIIEKAINEWDYYPEVKQWKKNNFKFILSLKFKHFDYGSSLQIGSIKKFANLFSFNEEELAESIFEILPQKIDILTDESIYSSFELLKSKLSPTTNEQLLTWVLDRWNKNIKPDFADGIWNDTKSPPLDSNENVACFLRFLLGHPDKKLRWRAIHSIRRMVELENTDILNILLKKQNNQKCNSFQDEKYIFYWMSAKLYLWIAIDRISVERAESLIQFKEDFYNELLSSDLPHVLIRKYIKQTCLNLYKVDSSVYRSDQLEKINDVNISKLSVKPKNRELKTAKSKKEFSLKFKFDSMDTIPYWYSRLGRLFDLSGYNVAEIADNIISEQWGYVGDPNKDDYIKGQLNQNTWGLTQNRHGSDPEIEDLQIYFEYHGMYCAASKLLDEQQLVGDDWDTWEDRLDSEANKFSEFWISDLRDPLPLRKDLWKNDVENFDSEWKNNIEDDYFDSNIFINDEKGISSLCVYGDIDKNIGKVTERIDISSCLIPSESDEEVLKSLREIKDHYDYYFPIEKSEIEDQEYVSGHLIEPWLKNISSDFQGLDSHDPYVHNIAKWIIRLDEDISEEYGITYDHLNKAGYIGNEEVSHFENWHEISEDSYKRREYSNALETSGKFFKVDLQFIMRLLKKEKKSLLIRCIVKREIDDKRDWHLGNREDIDNRNEVKLYLVKEDGSVKVLRGKTT